jgi:hypothetical protein
LTKKAPYKGLGADSEEKREPVTGIDTAVVDSLKVLDPERPIREADMARSNRDVRITPERWGNRPANLWIAEDFGCCASG